ncbi:hypothetical protein [Bacteroides stercorirosoris]|uniref:Uncharacterized protein n=1 Tax=Bacteroides stercorirosoris TaxID=871324 RepID=A0A1M6IVN8_9BACE|nr:hypothetical protein [Bacteroides stercorirosoris]OKZ08495.1 MAG: hypothetical protein BHV75_14380 [Bacteroides oleiciplenus]SHJ38409.1 hypothetical protein SAMN05444350_12543 [Bacteroides stercorirosoris]
MDISEIIKIYNIEQKNVFTGFCIQLPLIFTILYLYIPQFNSLDIYLQVIFSATASVLSIYYSYGMLCLCSVLAKHQYKLEILILICPMLATSFYLIRSPESYSLGHEYALSIFLRSSAIIYAPIAFIGFIIRKCKEYDIKHKGD